MKKKSKAYYIAQKDPSWRSIKWGLPREDRFVQWSSSKGIIVYRSVSAMSGTNCLSKKAKFRLAYWRPIKLKTK